MTDHHGTHGASPSRSAPAARLVIAAASAAALSAVGMASLIGKLDTIVNHRRLSRARCLSRWARLQERTATVAQEVSLLRWHWQVHRSTPDDARLPDNLWRGPCARCGDRMGQVHECRDLGR